jgi:hypothetical protein
VDCDSQRHEQRDHDRREHLRADLPEHAWALEPAPRIHLSKLGCDLDGNVQGVANYGGVEGVQLVHNPPAIEATWEDYFTINYCNGVCF